MEGLGKGILNTGIFAMLIDNPIFLVVALIVVVILGVVAWLFLSSLHLVTAIAGVVAGFALIYLMKKSGYNKPSLVFIPIGLGVLGFILEQTHIWSLELWSVTVSGFDFAGLSSVTLGIQFILICIMACITIIEFGFRIREMRKHR